MEREAEDPPTSIVPPVESNFSQVVFTNVQKFYPPKTDVRCEFRRGEGLEVSNKDWVGIFKVGWKTTSEYFTWIFVPTCADSSVLFKAYYLPKDDDYYQFCYVDHNGEVRGASIPFQFCLNIPEDEDDTLWVTSEVEIKKTYEENAELKKEVEKLTEERSQLQEQVSSLQNENQAHAERIQSLQDDLQSSTETLQRLETENMELTVQVKNHMDENARLIETIQTLNNELQMQRSQEEKLLSEIKEMEISKENTVEEKKNVERLQNNVKILEELNEKLESELKLHREKNQISLSDKEGLEKSLEKAMTEKTFLQNEAMGKQKAVENLTQTANQCKEETVRLKAEMELQACTLEKERKQKENLKQLLDKEIKKVLDLQRSTEERNKNLRSAEEKMTSLYKETESLKAENENKTKQMGVLHITIANLEGEVKRMKQECKMEAEGAAREVRTQLRSAEKTIEELERELARQKDTCRQQGEEIFTLRNALELREEEIQDLKDVHKNDRTQIDDLHSRLISRATNISTPPDQSLIFGNPYEGNDPSFSREHGSISGSTSGEAAQLTCVFCDQVFPPHEQLILEEHLMIHYSEYDAGS